jgi:hypothetical protein
MAGVNVKQFVFACFCTLTVVSAFIYLIVVLVSSPSTPPTSQLNSQTAIVDKIKITATPQITDKNLKIKLHLETYEFPEILKEDIKQYAIIKLSNLVVDNVNWIVESETKYVLEGNLEINLNSFLSKSDTINLELFFSESVSFNWIYK